MIEWADFKFGPVNLWSAPRQEIDYMRKEIEYIEDDIGLDELRKIHHQLLINLNLSIKKIAERRLKDLEFIYYTRTGRFPK